MFQTKLVSSLAKVFPDEVQGMEYTNATALRNEPFSFQIAYRACVRNGISIYAQIESDLEEELISCYKVGFVPVTNGYWKDTDAYYARTIPGMYPDTLIKRNTNDKVEMGISSSDFQSLWITVNEDSKVLSAGEHWMKVTFYNAADDRKLDSKTFQLTLIDALLPKQDVEYTTWLHCDCLADLYQVEMFGERHFEILASFVKAAGKHGITMLLLPAFTPPLDTRVNKERRTAQLVGVEVTEEGYRFDFTRMKRFIETCRENGVHRFEHSHLFTQWGAKHAPQIVAKANGEYKRIFGWETDSLDPSYGAFLTAYLKELMIFLKEMQIGKEDILFHISDEPEEEHLEYYKNAWNVIKSQVEGYHCGDALSGYEFYKLGYVETPIVEHYSKDIRLFIENCDNHWVYYTGGHSPEGYSNRLITNTSARNRILGVQMYYNNAKGFLHWGYNYYYGSFSQGLFNPLNDPGGFGQAPGMSYVVYPAADGTAVMSLRMKVQYEGFNDYRALQVLESYIGRSAVLEFLREQVGPIHYEDVWDEKTMLTLRSMINAKIRECICIRKYQMVCSDLDGTLLNTKAEVSLENLRAIEKLAEQGVFFVPSTGRSYSEVPAEIRSHPSIRYFICSNGAMVMDGQSGRSHLTGMSRQISQKIQAILGRYETHLTLRHDGKCYVDVASATEEAFDYYNVCEAHRLVINDFAVWHEHFTDFCENTDDVEVISVFFKHREELMAAREEIESLGGLQVVGVSDYNLEIMNAKAGKGNALLWLAEHLGIQREDTISVGDSDNDRSMVMTAGLGLAVSNACQSLKEAADKIICSNDEHAIQYIVEKLQ